MVAETMEEYALASAEADYENTGEHAPIGLVAFGGEIQGSENAYPWMDQKRSYLPSPTGTKNTRWETAAVCMSMAKEAIRTAPGSFNTPIECWGCINSNRYHEDRFHTYRNNPNNMDPDVSERAKQSIREYTQRTSMMGGSRGDQDN